MSKKDNTVKDRGKSKKSSSSDKKVVDSCGCFYVVDSCGCRVVDPCGCYVSSCCC